MINKRKITKSVLKKLIGNEVNDSCQLLKERVFSSAYVDDSIL